MRVPDTRRETDAERRRGSGAPLTAPGDGIPDDMHDELKWNKVFGAILATGLAIVALKIGAEMAFTPKPVGKPGYVVAIKEESAGAATDAPDTPPDWGTVLASADIAAGEQISGKCLSCHNFAQGGANQTGPNLWGVEGRKPASHEGFAYSATLTDYAGKHPQWSYDELYKFLAAPQGYMAGTKMSFVGLKKPEDRINVIAWLRTQGGTLPVPAPDPARAPGAAAAAPAAGGAPEAGAPADAAPAADNASGPATPAPAAADSTAQGSAPAKAK